MKLYKTRAGHRRDGLVVPPVPAKVQPEVDFTAEGSPPPGKVGSERPVLPDPAPDLDSDSVPAVTREDGAKR